MVDSVPRWIFILYLAIHGRLQTKDRVARWNEIEDLSCPLCAGQSETLEHLFFLCPVSGEIWRRVLRWQGITRIPTTWCDEVNWAMNNAKGNSVEAHIYKMTLAAGVYLIWKERNLRHFQHKSNSISTLTATIVQEGVAPGSWGSCPYLG
ncbi:uncharacterized protein LOC132612126 [Lycium barbarum]|uniref:uncharacterized protein LOC132612126 n=1 Tax=Lycium barbarum TaxID=112863 RepID=UPI00293EE406|nr:uncharacterized protein LOC132612126 [Lycium barbarum]